MQMSVRRDFLVEGTVGAKALRNNKDQCVGVEWVREVRVVVMKAGS